MAKTVTRDVLRTAVRNRGEFRSAYIDDTELNTYINVSLAHLYDIIISADPTYYLEYDEIITANGVRAYALPSDFYKCVGVAIVDATAVDGYSVLERFNFEERYDSLTISADRDYRYEIRGTNMYFHPEPNGVETIRLEYIPTPTQLDDDVTTWDSVNLWTEWVVMDVLVACGAKEETDVTVWTAQREKIEQRIRAIGQRDLGEVKTSSTATNLRGLRSAIRNRGKWTREDISDNQLTQWINSGFSGLLDVVCKGDPSYFISYQDITITAGTREYALPSSFYKVVGVDAYDSGLTDGYYQLEHFNWDERYDETQTSAKSSTRYSIRGTNIYFQPTPTWSGTVRLEYISELTALDDPTDTFDFPNDYAEWVILDGAIKAAAFMGTDPQVYLAQQQKVEARIASFGVQDLVEPAKPSTTTNLRSLQLAVRARGNWDKSSFSDSQLTEWINEAQAALVDVMSVHDPTYFMSEHFDVLVAGTESYALPSDFYKAVSLSCDFDRFADANVDIYDGYYLLQQATWAEYRDRTGVESTTAGTSTNNTTALRWTIRGNNVYFMPTPSSVWSDGYAFRLDYIAEPTAMTEPTDTPADFPNRWIEWIIIECAIKAAGHMGTDPQVYMAQQQKLEERIAAFSQRDISDRLVPQASSLRTDSVIKMIRARGQWDHTVISNNEICALIGTGFLQLHNLIVNVEPSFFYTEDYITVASGTRNYELPNNFYTLLGVSYEDDTLTDGYATMESFRWDERFNASYASSAATTRYAIQGIYLWLEPSPTWSGTIRLEYVRLPSIPSIYRSSSRDFRMLWSNFFFGDRHDDQNFSESYFWLEYLISDVAAKIATSVKQDPAQFLAQKQTAAEDIKQFLLSRDKSQQKTVSTSNSLRSLWQSIRGRGQWPREMFTDTQLTEWVNSSIAALVDMLIANETAYYLEREDVSVVSGTREYDLPSDFYKMEGVAVADTGASDGYYALDTFQWDERYDDIYSSNKWDARYLVKGGQIHFHPTPNWTDTVRLEYIPIPTALSAPSDTFDFENSWQEWVILDVAAKCAAYAGTDPQIYMAQKAAVEARIVTAAVVNVGAPKQVVDVGRRLHYGDRLFSPWRYRGR